MIIKWKKIQRMVEKEIKKPVNVALTTALDNAIISALSIDGDDINIVLNGKYCEDIDMVLKGIAHEVAHYTSGSMEDNESHKTEWNRLFKKYTVVYHKTIINK